MQAPVLPHPAASVGKFSELPKARCFQLYNGQSKIYIRGLLWVEKDRVFEQA